MKFHVEEDEKSNGSSSEGKRNSGTFWFEGENNSPNVTSKVFKKHAKKVKQTEWSKLNLRSRPVLAVESWCSKPWCRILFISVHFFLRGIFRVFLFSLEQLRKYSRFLF